MMKYKGKSVIKYGGSICILRWLNFFRKMRGRFCLYWAKHVVKSYGKGLKINDITWLTPKTKLGDNVNFNGLAIRGGGCVVIGDNFHSGVECLIINQVHDYDHGETIPYGKGYICKDVIIEDNVWIGSRVTILGGVTIGEGAIIQAGSTVVNDIPKYGIAGGHPAKVFKYREKEHYEQLKNKGLYL